MQVSVVIDTDLEKLHKPKGSRQSGQGKRTAKNGKKRKSQKEACLAKEAKCKTMCLVYQCIPGLR